MRLVWIGVLAAASALAQYSDLAATDDGRQIYFSSPLVLAGAAPRRPELRLYRIAEDGASLFAERGALANPNAGGSGDGAVRAQLSGDGQTVGYTLVDVCPPPGPCTHSEVIAELRGRYAATLGQGGLQLSRNGRWALLTPQQAMPGEPQAASTLIDLETGARVAVPAPATDRYALASDGTVLVRAPGPALWRGGAVTPLVFTGITAPWALSDDGRIAIFTQIAGPPGVPVRLVARDLASATDTTLFVSTQERIYPRFLALSNDGRRVLYVATSTSPAGDAYVADTRTGQSQGLPLAEGEQAGDGTLSGDGSAAFLATTAGRIVKFALAGGAPAASEELLPATPYVADPRWMVPGSLVWLGGVPGTAADLSGRILLDERPLPVLSAGGGRVAVQVPWEQRTGEVPFRVAIPTASPLQQNELATVAPLAPQVTWAPAGVSAMLGLLFIKGDFSGLVTEPPGPGDVIVTYMTGLGAVQGSPLTGVPAPNEPLMPATGTLRCRFRPQQGDAETLFAGLAPGMIGVYQVVFRMPADAGAPVTCAECSYQNAAGSSGWNIQGLMRPPGS